MFKQILPSIRMTLCIAVLTGLIFPFIITLMASVFFSSQAGGSMLKGADGHVIGSALIGQRFDSAHYFHGRPSNAGSGYCGEASGGTNLGPTSNKLINGADGFDGVKQLAEKYRADNKLTPEENVPVDAVTRSGSGLDPDISQANAYFQARRVAGARGLSEEQVLNVVRSQTCGRQLGVLGEPRVNVLKLNLALDALNHK